MNIKWFKNHSNGDHFFRNVFLNCGDAVFLETANGMTPLGTIVSSLLRYVTPSKTLISSLGALSSIVQGVPQLFAARKMEQSVSLKRLLLLFAFMQRFMWLILAGLVV